MTNSPVDTHRFLRIRSALGDDLICNRFAGNEKLGCLFDYQLGLLSGDPDIPGKLVLKDFDFEKPKIDLVTDIQDMSRSHPTPMNKDEIFDYPGEYVELNDGNTSSRIRLEGLQAQFERVQAGGDAKGMCSGYLFTLEGHPRENQNQEYLIIAVSHDIKCDAVETISAAVAEDHYFCQLELMLKTEQYRSERITPKPLVQGLQTATAVS